MRTITTYRKVGAFYIACNRDFSPVDLCLNRLGGEVHPSWDVERTGGTPGIGKQARFLISIQVGNSVRPMHLFGHKFDHDYYFELLREEERAAHSITRCFTAHHRLFRAGPRANRTF